jgi:hypothetical protein
LGEAIAGESIAVAELPQDLSPWGMFLNADTIVKAATRRRYLPFMSWLDNAIGRVVVHDGLIDAVRDDA